MRMVPEAGGGPTKSHDAQNPVRMGNTPEMSLDRGARYPAPPWEVDHVRIAVLILVLAPFGFGLAACRSNIERQSAEAFTHRPGTRTARTFHYLLYRPPGHAAEAAKGFKWPLLVYLPGFVSFGDDVGRLADGDPPEEIERGRDFPMVVITPMTPTLLERWSPRALIALIDDAIARYDVDPARVYISGVSFGGSAVWDVIKAYPERIAAAVPVCGWSGTGGMAQASQVPVWAFHGALDLFVPPPLHKRAADAHRAAGGETRWTSVPGSMHWIWVQTYRREDIYAWMLSHRKSAGR
jgi:predicted peptidase